MSDEFETMLVDSAFTEEISNRMQVPDRISLAGDRDSPLSRYAFKDEDIDRFNFMNVPSRIQIGDNTTTSRTTPDIDLDRSTFASSHVRVLTPPQSIQLQDITPPRDTSSPPQTSLTRRLSESTAIIESEREALSPWEEIQGLRRQMAKLNHRLMAVELENQQQQQRELVLTGFLSLYLITKFIIWLNKPN